jgi:prefoldin subunit 5
MIEERIRKSESAVKASQNIPAQKKDELLSLLAKLRSAVAKVSQTHPEDAQSVATHIEASTDQATRGKNDPEQLKTALRKLKESVEKFESSHPELVIYVNEFATALSAMGL